MTNDEYELIADVLRRRVNEITKMFKEPDTYVDDVSRAMKVQVLLVAQDLEVAFHQRDPALKENIFVGAVQDEMNRKLMPTEFTPSWASGEPRYR